MVWRVSHVTAADETSHDAMPYPSKEEAIKQARLLLRGGAKDVWITDSDGNHMDRTTIRTRDPN
jgi:hypothetical protein